MKKSLLSISIVFMFLCSCKQEIENRKTPLALEEINEIGELFCAKYYGETIESFKKSKKTLVIKDLQRDYRYFRLICLRQESKGGKDRKLVKYFRKNNLFSDERYKRLKKITNIKNNKDLLDTISEKAWSDKIIKDDLLEEYFKDIEKVEIIYLARGWVKAGFKLNKLKYKENIIFSGDTLIIRNLDPEILNTDINPWLEPGEIRGFEILKAKNKFSYDDVLIVKKRCKQNLLAQALKSGILDCSISAGEESLEGLLGFIENPYAGNISKVIIKPSVLYEIKADCIFDQLLDAKDTSIINTTYNKYIESFDSTQFCSKEEQLVSLYNFIDELTYTPYDITIDEEKWYNINFARLETINGLITELQVN